MKKLLLILAGLVCFATTQGFAQHGSLWNVNYSQGTLGSSPTQAQLNSSFYGSRLGSNGSSGCTLNLICAVAFGAAYPNAALTTTSTWRCSDTIPGNNGGASAQYLDYNTTGTSGVQNIFFGFQLPSMSAGQWVAGVEWTCFDQIWGISGTVDDFTVTGFSASALGNITHLDSTHMAFGLEGTCNQNGWPNFDCGIPMTANTTFQLFWAAPYKGACDVISTVNTSGTSVTQTSGAVFPSTITDININGIVYQVATFNSSTSLTLSSSAGTQTGVASSLVTTPKESIAASCITLALYTRTASLVGFEYKSTGNTPGTPCSGTCQPTAFYSGDLNGDSNAGSTAHFQHANLLICTDCDPNTLPLLESPAPPWQGIIAPDRAIDWTKAGTSPAVNLGTLPSSAWTQLGSTLAAGSYTAATINASLSGCANQYYKLGAGTFNVDTSASGVNPPTTCELRGSGSANTIFKPTTGSPPKCGQTHAAVCLHGTDGNGGHNVNTPGTLYTWTGGFAQGSTALTFSSTAGMAAGQILALDQDNTGFTGTTPTGCAIDNLNLFISGDIYAISGCNNPNGSSSNPGGGGRPERDGLEYHMIVSVAGNVVTIEAPGVMMPNFASGLSPQGWIVANPISTAGVVDMTIDLSNASVAETCVEAYDGYHVWTNQVICLQNKFAGFNYFQTINSNLQSSYAYGTTASLPSGYGFRVYDTSLNVIQNNNCQNIAGGCYFKEASAVGDVWGYNGCVSSFVTNSMTPCATQHWVDPLNLDEGNCFSQNSSDNVHGTTDLQTRFRNCYFGWQSNPSTALTAFTNAITDWAKSRYSNNIANILGTPGYHTSYTSASSATAIYNFGTGNTTSPGGVTIPTDSLSSSTSLLSGNYDTFNTATRFQSSEAPSAASTYPNGLPVVGNTGVGQAAFPASFYLTAKPSWFGSTPWPPIGPDITGGDVGECSQSSSSATGLNTGGQRNGSPAKTAGQCPGSTIWANAWAGHINGIPALNCFLSGGGPVDGSGAALNLDLAACFGGAAPPVTPPFSPASSFFSKNESGQSGTAPSW